MRDLHRPVVEHLRLDAGDLPYLQTRRLEAAGPLNVAAEGEDGGEEACSAPNSNPVGDASRINDLPRMWSIEQVGLRALPPSDLECVRMHSRDEILDALRNSREDLRRDFGVESIALFGSVARGDADASSDIDILVEVPGPISLFGLVALQLRLQELLNAPKVDVVLRDSIFPPLRERILAEALRVA